MPDVPALPAGRSSLAAAAAVLALMLAPSPAAAADEAATPAAGPEAAASEAEALPPGEVRGQPDPAAGGQAALRSALEQREALIERLEAAAEQRAEQQRQLEARLEELRARLPAREGGSLTAEAARKRAAEEAGALARLAEDGRGIDNPELWRRLRAAEDALHHSQYLLARASDARTVYRVRPGDSLAGIGAFFYGEPDAWRRLYEANRHVLDTPEPLLPGITLLIP